MLMAIVLSLLVAIIVSGAVVLTGTSRINAIVKGNSEASLLLAEGGINAEINKVNTAIQAGNTFWDTPTSKGSGTLGGVPGSYTVWTSANPSGAYDGTDLWSGSGSFWVTCTATTGDAIRTVHVLASVTTPSVFTTASLFALDNLTGSSAYALNLSNGAQMSVIGSMGTNGIFTESGSTCNFNSGADYGSIANLTDAANTAYPAAPIVIFPIALVFPTVPSIIRSSIPATSGMSDADTWSWMEANVPESEMSTIYTWSGSSTTLSTSSSTKAYTSDTPGTLLNSSFWAGDVINNDPNTGRQAIILQPGDYYFTNLDAIDSTKEIIIDNAGLTLPGGNPTKKQVRIWVGNASGADVSQIAIPIIFTNPNDPSTFRIYYSNNQGRLQLDGTTTIVGGIYAYAGVPSSSVWATLDFSNGNVTMIGSIIADQIKNNAGTLSVTYVNPSNAADPSTGTMVAVIGGYDDGGNFGG